MHQRIIDCETEYYKCFSTAVEEADVIRFRDPLLPDMYYHNFTYIRCSADPAAAVGRIEKEIDLRRGEEAGFCNILSGLAIGAGQLKDIAYPVSLSTNGFYLFDKAYLLQMKAPPHCNIRRVDSQAMVEDALYSDLQHDEKRLGRDFCERRCLRRGKVYVQDGGVDSYNCYDNGSIVGNCDLFMHKGVAKIEDFTVIPKYQRKGYGTTILKHLIQTALDADCDTIYLVTDEEDTPKDMYVRLGFSKIGERTDLFFDLAENKA